MKFTVVTICYNHAEFIQEAIRSVVDQDYPDIEYIIADGGSNDGSVAIIDRYRDRAQVLLGPDGGPADALNKAFACATGDVLGFLNSDDVLLPGAIRTVARRWEARLDRVDFVSGHCLITDRDGNILRRAYSDRFDVRRHAHGACILLQPATFFTRKIYQRVGGFNPANRVSWDAELYFEFGMVGARHAVIPDFLAAYRVHEASITGENRSAETRLRLRAQRLRRYLGREVHFGDRLRAKFFLYQRKLLNPQDTIARLTGGPIGGRFKK